MEKIFSQQTKQSISIFILFLGTTENKLEKNFPKKKKNSSQEKRSIHITNNNKLWKKALSTFKETNKYLQNSWARVNRTLAIKEPHYRLAYCHLSNQTLPLRSTLYIELAEFKFWIDLLRLEPRSLWISVHLEFTFTSSFLSYNMSL